LDRQPLLRTKRKIKLINDKRHFLYLTLYMMELFSDFFKCWPSPELDGSKRPEEGSQYFTCGDMTDASFIFVAEPPSEEKARVLNKRNPSKNEEQMLTAERRFTNRNNRKTIFRSRGFEDLESFPTETKPFLVSCLLQNNIFNEGLCNYQNIYNLDQSPSGPLHETPSAIIVTLSDGLDVHEGGSYENPSNISHVPINDTSFFDDERLDYEHDDCLIQKLKQMHKWKKTKPRRKKLTEQFEEQIAKGKLRYRPSPLLSDNDIVQKVENIISRANKPIGSPRSVADVPNVLDAP